MRIAIVQETVDVARGGAETATSEMARHLAALGLDVSLVCSGGRSEACDLEGVALRPIPARGPTRAWRTYQFVQAVNRLCHQERFDIVHAITPCPAADVYQPRAGTYSETVARNLVRIRGPVRRHLSRLGRYFNVRQRFLMHLEQTLLRKRRQRLFVAAISDYVRRQVMAYGFPAERTRLVYNAVDVTWLPPQQAADCRTTVRAGLGVADGVPLLLFAAHNFKLKGLAELLHGCAMLNRMGHAGWRLAVAGRGKPGAYRRLAWLLGLAEQVSFVGPVADMASWYAAADLLVHPTWYDPCSRVVLEAVSLGLPVVTTRHNGAAEVIKPGRQGEVIDSPADPVALAGALTRALRPEVRAACRRDAEQLREYLSMARHARELKALYEEIAGEKGAAGRGLRGAACGR